MAEEPIYTFTEKLNIGRESEDTIDEKVKLNKNQKEKVDIPGLGHKEGNLKGEDCVPRMTVQQNQGNNVESSSSNFQQSCASPGGAWSPSSPTAMASGDTRTTFSANHEEEGDPNALNVPDRLKFEMSNDEEEEDSKSTDIVEKKDEELNKTDAQSNVFKEFEEWLLVCGAQFPDLYLKRYTGDVRGVHASRRVGPYVCLVQIPLKCLITDHMGRTETEIGKKLFSAKSNLSTPNLIAVIVYILTTREDPNHFFQPYYKILPKDYTNFPIFYNEEQLSWLDGSPLIDDIYERKRNMQADYEEVCRVCPEFKRFSFGEFLEVRTAVGSRNFGIVVHGQKRTAMVPYADMLNHYRPRETSWTFEDSKDAFTITSLSALQAGQQVMDSYGKKCNSKFLLHYGFAVECNREEDGKCQNEIYLRLTLRPTAEDPLQNLRFSILGQSRMSRGFRLSMNIEDKATSEALSFCRIACATEEELNTILVQTGIMDDQGSQQFRRSYRDSYRDSTVNFVSIRNEVAALEMLATACQRQLDCYPQSYEENQRLLRDGNIKPFSVRRTALIVILGEQEICSFWIYACETISEVLGATSNVPLHLALRSLPRTTYKETDLARYASRLAYEIRMASKQ